MTDPNLVMNLDVRSFTPTEVFETQYIAFKGGFGQTEQIIRVALNLMDNSNAADTKAPSYSLNSVLYMETPASVTSTIWTPEKAIAMLSGEILIPDPLHSIILPTQAGYDPLPPLDTIVRDGMAKISLTYANIVDGDYVTRPVNIINHHIEQVRNHLGPKRLFLDLSGMRDIPEATWYPIKHTLTWLPDSYDISTGIIVNAVQTQELSKRLGYVPIGLTSFKIPYGLNGSDSYVNLVTRGTSDIAAHYNAQDAVPRNPLQPLGLE